MIENHAELLDVEQVAQMMAISKRTIQRLVKKGAFPHAFRAGDGTRSRWRFTRADVENFIKQQQPGATQGRGKKRSSTG